MREGRATHREQGVASVSGERMHEGFAVDDERVAAVAAAAAVARHVPQCVVQLLTHRYGRQRISLLKSPLIL